ncbi:MAG TPA: alpha/beta hydrolase [Patescibacteria group bacterium]|nr:alpha/beta hydrolase [Patescibacteria group bacterium]
MKNPIEYDNIIILHGCPATSTNIIPKNQRWMNWLAEQLREKGYNATAPDMPTPWAPKYEVWKKEFEKYQITKNSLLVGHSCGAAFFVRWLLDTGRKVKKLILVAPAKISETDADSRQDLYRFDLPMDASHIADEIVVFTSNDFPHHLKSLELYKKALKPRVVKLENKGHFLIFTMGTNEFPELLDEIIG